MRFDEVEQTVRELKQQLREGRLTRAEVEQRLKELMIQDEDGHWWMIGFDTGKWYRNVEGRWETAEPSSDILETDVRVAPVMATPTTRPERRRGITAWSWIVGGLGSLCGIIGLLMGGSGWISGSTPQVVEVEVTREVEVEVTREGDGYAVPVTFAGGGDTLAEVQDRGILNCGVSGSLPAFSFVEDDGSISGFDADYCRAVAAAVLSDAEAVEFRPLTATERFPVLQSGQIDVLIRNTTWTISRDTSLGFDFAPTTFYTDPK